MVERFHYIKVRNILIGILILNFSVALAKIIYGSISKSSSMIADGYHSLSDGTGNIVGIIGIWIASKPADENHPYGHYKFETMASIVIGLLLFFVAFQILTEAYDRFINPINPEINPYSFIVMIVTLIINFLVSSYETRKGKELKSSILISDASNTRSDVYVSISVIISLIASKYNLVIVDTIVAGVIAILIIRAGLEILIPSINVLSDASMINPDEIENIVMAYPDVIYCHRIRTRGKENHIMIDFHLGLDKDLTLDKAHKKSHEIKNDLLKEFQDVREIIIHTEPADKKV